MFTDMVGYTALGQRNESLALALVEEQRRVIRPVLARHNGREVKTIGDAFLVEFPNAVDAVRCAYDIQRATREFNLSLASESRIHLRVGVHVGEVVESHGDISGDAVNVASRIEPLAEDGGVCVTRQVYEFVRNKVDIQLSNIGPKSLKNVADPMEVYEMIMPWEKQQPVVQSLDRKRVAVLPFANMSPDPNDGYFADGMTEELISTVSKISELQVISRTSVMRYRDGTAQVAQIGRDLSVGTVLEGSVRKAGNKVRITAQLIEVEGDKHVWSQSYDRDLTDVFAIQADIAEQVANSLKVQLLSSEKQSIRKEGTSNPDAHTLYLKGRFYLNERSEEGCRKALSYFEKAVTADPEFAMAYSGLSDGYNILSDYGWMAPHEALPLAKKHAVKALEIDENLAEAHASLALAIENEDWDLLQAEREYKRAIELNPNYANAYHWYNIDLFMMRRYEESASYERRALELDPYSRVYNMVSVNLMLFDEKYDEALVRYDELIKLYPDMTPLRLWRSICLVLSGRHDEAVAEALRYVAAEGGPWKTTLSMLHLAWVYASSGRMADAKEVVEKAIAESSRREVSSANVGWVKVLLGEKEEGYMWLRKAFEERDPRLLYFNGFPWSKEIRADPRWREIESRFSFPSVAN